MASAAAVWRASRTPIAVEAEAESMRDVAFAFDRTSSVRPLDDDLGSDEADQRLRVAVSAARDAGVKWGVIASALGIARGNAYQRYRPLPPACRTAAVPPL